MVCLHVYVGVIYVTLGPFHEAGEVADEVGSQTTRKHECFYSPVHALDPF